MKLATHIWVGALIRRAQAGGAHATVARKGEETGGAVLVKIYNPRTREARLYAETVNMQGERAWMQPAGGDEAALDAYAERARGRDPDLWVVEVEDAEGRHFLTEPVLHPPT